MRNIGIYYAFWCNEWDADFLPYIEKVKTLGYTQLEINGGTIVDMSHEDRMKLKKEADKYEIKLSYGIGLTEENDVSSLDEKTRLNGLNFMTKMIRAVGSMGGGTIGGTVYSSWPKQLPKGNRRLDYLNQSLKSMKVLSKIAEKENVILLCEVLNRFEQFLLNTCDQALDFVKEINSPNCKILLDTFHMNIEEDSIIEAIIKCGDYLGGLHLGENNRKPVGLGMMPWAEIKKALDKINFQGSLVQEPFVMSGGQVGQDIAVWRDIITNPNLDKLAKDSATYIKNNLA
ncbi:MAG: sugar phosphate isomerase/epimerase [Sphaerochaetaceae bacterium]|nr:sugar phosphate isomerase/epimerase [Sphaerochaetaceae bacterium]